MTLIRTSEQLSADASGVGSKALNLLTLKKLGCTVPEFVVLPATTIQNLSAQALLHIGQEVDAAMSAKRFAVRSAALIEDSQEHSFAGQFLTRIDVSRDELSDAVSDVVRHATSYLRGDLSSFSVIIQEYVPADFSGVAFTRHPSGLRQMLIEYHKGIGEELVSGQIKPTAIECVWTEELPASALPLAECVPLFKKIENAFGHPQDIEWCLRDGVWYFLQSRPITTITPDAYRGMRFLDEQLPSGKPFLYEKTEISEIASRPTPFTFSLLQRVYAGGGPIDRVYKQYGVAYEPRDFLRIVGNELYVDREEELKTILPSFSYFGRTLLVPTRTTFDGFWRTRKNTRALGKMSVKNADAFIRRVETALHELPIDGSIAELWKSFDACYALIFEINVLAAKFLQQMDLVLKSSGKTSVDILSSTFRQQFTSALSEPPMQDWQGNGLEVADAEPFVARMPAYAPNPSLDAWWSALPEWRKKFFQPFIERAVMFDALRERGRWLTVGYVNAFRRALGKTSSFATIEEAELGNIDQQHITERMRRYEAATQWEFPSRLTNRFSAEKRDAPKGVSAGRAEGVLMMAKDVPQQHTGSIILYTETLSPDLVQQFPRIRGIVSSKGGVLSHLSILAREQGIPVVVNVDLAASGIHLGDSVRIDGNAGMVERS